jgi:hypothetical protein
MRHLVLGLVAASLTSCATAVVGPYAQSFSPDDMRQIQELVAARRDMPKVILSVDATRKDCVYVKTSLPVQRSVDVGFTACKRDGKWQINEKSVEKYRSIVTE